MGILGKLFKKIQDSGRKRKIPGAVTREDLSIAQFTAVPKADFTLLKDFPEEQLRLLRKGFKSNAAGFWSWCMEGDTLYICRNQPGPILFYRIDLSLENLCHSVTVVQRTRMSMEAEKQFLLRWLDQIWDENREKRPKKKHRCAIRSGTGA